jgi:formylglycine-generating enzyme required for sulfatase activity
MEQGTNKKHHSGFTMAQRSMMTLCAISLLALSALLFPSCRNPFASYSDNSDSSTVGSLRIKLALGAPQARSTFYPSLSDLMVDHYTISGTGPYAGVEFSITVAGTETGAMIPDLVIGSWTITVEARNAADITIAAGTETVIIAKNGTQVANIILVPVTTGTGSIAVSLSWPSGELSEPAISGSLTPKDGSDQPLSFTEPAGNASSCLASDLDPGTYTLVIQLKQGAEPQARATLTVAVHVYSAITTPVTIEVVSAQLNSPPPPPANLFAQPLDENTIRFSWQSASITTRHWLCEFDGEGSFILPATANEYVATPDDSDAAHSFRIQAVNDFGVSDWVILSDIYTLRSMYMFSIDGGTYVQTPDSGAAFTHTVSPFWIAQYELTYEIWYQVYSWATMSGYSFANPGSEGHNGIPGAAPTARRREPVTMVNWRDAIAWCNAYSELLGLRPVYYTNAAMTNVYRDSTDGAFGSSQDTSPGGLDNPYVDWTAPGYRLPTEGEWQYAASDRGSTPYNHAAGAPVDYTDAFETSQVAWYQVNSGNMTHEVGLKNPNATGLYDMSGNVFEWCWDLYGLYPGTEQTNYKGVFSSDQRIYRGGSWGTNAYGVQVGIRNIYEPYRELASVGLRLAQTTTDPDETAPESISLMVPVADGLYTEPTLNMLGTAYDYGSGMAWLYYAFAATDTPPVDLGDYETYATVNGAWSTPVPLGSGLGELPDGIWYVHILAEDNVGNRTPIANALTRRFMVDTAAPVLFIDAPSEGAAFKEDFVIAGTASDANGVDRVEVSLNGGIIWILATLVADNWTMDISLVDLGLDGSKEIHVRAVDTVGRSTTLIRNIIIDTTAPALTILNPVNLGLVSTSDLSAFGTAMDIGAGLALIKYAITVNPAPPDPMAYTQATGTANWTATVDLSVVADGNYWFHAFAVDAAGNQSVVSSIQFIWDSNPPEVTETSIGATTEVYKNSTFSLAGSAADANGIQSLTVTQSKDGSAHVLIDVNPPTSSDGWATWTLTGLPRNPADIGNFWLVEGIYEYTITATDMTGDDTALQRRVTVDTTPPITTIISPVTDQLVSTTTLSAIGTADDNIVLQAVYAVVTPNPTPPVGLNNYTLATGTYAWSFSLDLLSAGLPEGALYLHTMAVDTAGNQSAVLTVPFMWTIDTSDYISPTIGTFKYVPAGSFQRDATATNITVITRPYRMSEHEITRAQFLAVMGTDPSNTSYSIGINDPVQSVSWYDAIAFCNKLSIAEGLVPVYSIIGVDFSTLTYVQIPTTRNTAWDATTATWANNGYRLPTHMEWMWAAMGAASDATAVWSAEVNTTGYAKAFAGSNGSNAIGDYAWYNANSGSTTQPVGMKTANELGLYDMSGNVFEHNWDDYFPVYPVGILYDPTLEYDRYAIKSVGGDATSNASVCSFNLHSDITPYYRGEFHGFRVVARP